MCDDLRWCQLTLAPVPTGLAEVASRYQVIFPVGVNPARRHADAFVRISAHGSRQGRGVRRE